VSDDPQITTPSATAPTTLSVDQAPRTAISKLPDDLLLGLIRDESALPYWSKNNPNAYSGISHSYWSTIGPNLKFDQYLVGFINHMKRKDRSMSERLARHLVVPIDAYRKLVATKKYPIEQILDSIRTFMNVHGENRDNVDARLLAAIICGVAINHCTFEGFEERRTKILGKSLFKPN